jgi:hypothetical protein
VFQKHIVNSGLGINGISRESESEAAMQLIEYLHINLEDRLRMLLCKTMCFEYDTMLFWPDHV